MRKWLGVVAATLAGTLAAAPVHAGWVRAESPHFVVYADDSEREVGKFAENLERFHAAMTVVTGRKAATPSPSNRVVIFALGSEAGVQKLMGDKSGTLAGFYTPRAGGSRAFVPSIRIGKAGTDFSDIVLLHEYAHHFLISSSRVAMPRWMNEGAAEFFASAKFESDGSVGIGRPANHRGYELAEAVDVPVVELLDQKLYSARKSKQYDAFYGRSWALYHYLMMDDVQKGPRQGQLRAYANAIAAGKSEREASAVFGDLAVLEKNLDAYVKRTRMSYFQIGSDKLPPPRIVTTVLSKGESEVMPLLIQSQRGVSREKALALLPQVRKVAERFPQDVGVLTALAEAEHDAGNDELAVAAADKALALDPSRVNAYVQKGYALHRAAEKAPPARRPALLKAAMKPFEALNRLENDHPLPLIYFYRSFAQQGLEPPDLARQALERASQLAPFDEGLTFEVALMHAREGKIGLAKSGLSALAGNPHGGRLAATAMKLGEAIAVLSEGTPWRGQVELLEIDAGEAVNVG